MSLLESQKNCLINILNVLAHISDHTYIRKCWNTNTVMLLASDKLESNSICKTIVFNCREAFGILEDNNFYDLVEPAFGFWSEFVKILKEDTFKSLVSVVEQILLFNEKSDIDLDGDELLKDLHWLRVMESSEIALKYLKDELDIHEDDYLY